MIKLEDVENKQKVLQEFFVWLFDDNRIIDKSISLYSETDLSLCHDYLDSSIYYPYQIKKFFETPAMQRLSRISQLGLAINLSENLYHSRLEHSKGVYNRKLEEFFYNFQNPDWKNYIEKNNLKLHIIADLIKMAGHDIGHPPFSHAMERTIFGFIGAHEIIGKRIMLEDTSIRSVIDNISPDLYNILSELYEKDILNFKSHNEGSYDVDRLDYLTRDSLYSGFFSHLSTQQYERIPISCDRYNLPIRNKDYSISEDKNGTNFIDVYPYSALKEIEATLMLRNQRYKEIYFSPLSQVYETCIGNFLDAFLSSNSASRNNLKDLIENFSSTPIEKIDLNEYIKWDEIGLYASILDIAEFHEDKNVRDLATMIIPNMDAFLNLLYSHMNINRKSHNYTESEKVLLRKVKDLISHNSNLSMNVRNKNFALKNTLVLPNNNVSLLDKSLIDSNFYKIKSYKTFEPIYVRDRNGNIFELSQHPDTTIDWGSEVEYLETNLVYVPFLRFKGVSEDTINTLKNLYPTANVFENPNYKPEVNMSLLSVDHNMEDIFLEL